MKYQLLLASFLFTIHGFTQTGVFIDPRDNQSYSTIVIEGKTWFRENLRYQTSKSYCPNFNKNAADCSRGNYYSNSELKTICPPGWHVSTIADWESYLAIFVRNYQVNDGILKFDTSEIVPNHYSFRTTNADISSDTLIRLLPTGWVEGVKLRNADGISFWAFDEEGQDDKYHFHLGKEGVIKHTHKHHVVDKPARIRKFPVRCVCDTVSTGAAVSE